MTEKIEITAPSGEDRARDGGARDVLEDHREPGLVVWVLEVLDRLGAHAGDRDQHVERDDDGSAPMIARGMVRCGSFTSSPAVDTASRPMNEKKIVPAAAVTPGGAGAEVGEMVAVEGGERR